MASAKLRPYLNVILFASKLIIATTRADFMADFSPNLQIEADEELLQQLEQTSTPKWTLCIDGAIQMGQDLDLY